MATETSEKLILNLQNGDTGMIDGLSERRGPLNTNCNVNGNPFEPSNEANTTNSIMEIKSAHGGVSLLSNGTGGGSNAFHSPAVTELGSNYNATSLHLGSSGGPSLHVAIDSLFPPSFQSHQQQPHQQQDPMVTSSPSLQMMNPLDQLPYQLVSENSTNNNMNSFFFQQQQQQSLQNNMYNANRRYSLNDHAIAMRRMERKASSASDTGSFFMGHRQNSHSYSSLPGSVGMFFPTNTSFTNSNNMNNCPSPYAQSAGSPYAAHSPFATPTLEYMSAPVSPFVQPNQIFAPDTILDMSPSARSTHTNNSSGGSGGNRRRSSTASMYNSSSLAAPSLISTSIPEYAEQSSANDITFNNNGASFTHQRQDSMEQKAFISTTLLQLNSQATYLDQQPSSVSTATTADTKPLSGRQQRKTSSSTTKSPSSPSASTGSKPKRAYKCNIDDCELTFGRLSSLQEHALSHSSDYAIAKVKPFTCPVCDQTFSRSHGTFHCPLIAYFQIQV